MTEIPEGYGYKDLTPLGKALDKIEILQKKLDIAKEALKVIGYPPDEWDDASDRAINALFEIEKMK
jgi:hypothetical protein